MTRASVKLAGALLLASTLALGGCANGADPTLTRVGAGAGGGALAGAAIGSFSGNMGMGALIGAGVGTAGGLLFDYHRRSNDAAYQRGRRSATQQ